MAHRGPAGRMRRTLAVAILPERHAQDGQRQDRRAAHGVDVGQRVGGGDAAEIVGIVDHRHEKVGGGDQGQAVGQAVHRGVVRRFGADHQVREGAGGNGLLRARPARLPAAPAARPAPACSRTRRHAQARSDGSRRGPRQASGDGQGLSYGRFAERQVACPPAASEAAGPAGRAGVRGAVLRTPRWPKPCAACSTRSRAELRRGEPVAVPDPRALLDRAAALAAAARAAPRLRRVINATGIVLHTNLGRAPLAAEAMAAVTEAAGYCNLEFDLGVGRARQPHAGPRAAAAQLTGAEAALAVNNCAAAVLLALSGLAGGRRGDRVARRAGRDRRRLPHPGRDPAGRRAAGGGRHHQQDPAGGLRAAITPATRVLLKVHQSNFRITGFTEEAPLHELAALARATGPAGGARSGQRRHGTARSAARRSRRRGQHRRRVRRGGVQRRQAAAAARSPACWSGAGRRSTRCAATRCCARCGSTS